MISSLAISSPVRDFVNICILTKCCCMEESFFHHVTSIYSLNSRKLPGHFSYNQGMRLAFTVSLNMVGCQFLRVNVISLFLASREVCYHRNPQVLCSKLKVCKRASLALLPVPAQLFVALQYCRRPKAGRGLVARIGIVGSFIHQFERPREGSGPTLLLFPFSYPIHTWF